MSLCKVCSNKIDRGDDNKIQCVLCANYYHAICVQIKSSDLDYFKKNNLQWKCSFCLEKARRSINSPPCTPILPKNNSKLDTICDNIKILTKSLEDTKLFLFKKFEQLEKSLMATVNSLQIENTNLKTIVNKLECRVDNLEQSLIHNCVDIIGIPFSKDPQNIKESVLNLFNNTLESNISSNNIVSCYQKKIPFSNNRFKNIICVKFDTRESKNSVFKSKSRLKTKPFEFSFDKNEVSSNYIFMNHSLTKNKRLLYNAAKKIKSEFNVKHLWIMNGQILMRIQDGSEIININCVDDLNIFQNNK